MKKMALCHKSQWSEMKRMAIWLLQKMLEVMTTHNAYTQFGRKDCDSVRTMIGMHTNKLHWKLPTEREKKRTIENANELQWATLEQISINANEKKMSVDQSAGEPASDNSKKRLVNIGSICVDSYKYGLANATTEQNITYNA